MWWQGTETARLARHVRVDPSLFDDPDSDEWFVDAAGMIVDAAGQRV